MREQFSEKTNSNTKTQALFLLNNLHLEVELLWEKLLVYFNFFERTLKGEFLFDPEQQFKIAIISLGQSDRELCAALQCDKETLELCRRKLIASLIMLLPPEISCVIEQGNETSLYLKKLQSASGTRFTKNARAIARLPQTGPAVAAFFNSYATNFTVYNAFKEQGVYLPEQELFNYDRGVRYFLNPEKVKEQGLQNVLKRYLFCRIATNIDSIAKVIGHMEAAAQVEITRFSPEYSTHYAIRKFLEDHELVKELRLTADHIGLKNLSAHKLSDNHVMLCAFIFNLYLLDPRLPETEELYRLAMTTRPKHILDSMRNAIANEI